MIIILFSEEIQGCLIVKIASGFRIFFVEIKIKGINKTSGCRF